jgi:hypothetical protein
LETLLASKDQHQIATALQALISLRQNVIKWRPIVFSKSKLEERQQIRDQQKSGTLSKIDKSIEALQVIHIYQ